MQKSYLFLALILSISLFQSCVKDPIDDQNNAQAPELPLQETFVMPFEAFADLDTTGLVADDVPTSSFLGGGPTTFKNWFHAGTSLLVWGTVQTLQLAVPVAAFGEAFNHNPIHIGNGVFAWNYTSQVGNDTYEITLTGQFINNNEDIQWALNASKIGGFTDFEWYTGVTSVDGSGSTWTLNRNPNNPETHLEIVFQKDVSAGTSSIRYTDITSSNNNGYYIEYRIDPAGAFNRAYNVYLGSDNKFLEIEWNEPTKEGRVKHPAHFNDEEWHCWDEDRMDIDC